MRLPFGGSSLRSGLPVLVAVLMLATCSALAADAPAAFKVPSDVRAVLTRHCADCHAEDGEGNVDLMALESLKTSNRLDALNKIQDQLFHEMMPPPDSPRPEASDVRTLADWVRGELRLHKASKLDDHLPYPDAGNYVDHVALFDGSNTEKAYTPARRGLVSPQIFRERVLNVFQLDGHGRNGFRQTEFFGVANPIVLPAALISGLTNVAAFTIDELGAFCTGLPGLEGERVSLHDVGHGKGFGKLTADEIRFAVQRRHMATIDTIATRLKNAPEGDGTVFDNTMIFYFPGGGETHHAVGTEYPFVVLSGKNAKLDIRGKYIRLPNYGDAGHKTLGNWYTTLLNAYGNPVKHYGDLDSGLDRFGLDRTGAIRQFIG